MMRGRYVLLGLLILSVLELWARAVHDPYNVDFLFDWSFWDRRVELQRLQDRLPERARIPLTEGGFRGRWAKGEKAPGAVRVIVTGAGHTFADNLSYGQAWPERLEATLQQKGRTVEVWNMAVNGSTVLFAERCLLDDILQAAPDVVVLSHSGYNEALRADVPEELVVFDTMNWRNAALSSALVRRVVWRGARGWAALWGIPRTHKVPIERFNQSYDSILGKLQAAKIPVILLQQEVITKDIAPIWFLEDLELYRAAFFALSKKHGAMYVSPRAMMMGDIRDYFDEQEYYSAQMHERVLHSITPLVESALP